MRKFFLPVLLTFIFVLPLAAQPESGQTLRDYCQQTYTTTTRCPVDACRLTCISHDYDQNACTAQCLPRPCFEIRIESCPLDECQVVKGCDGKYVCFPRIIVPAEGCGGLGYNGGEVDCCPGLTKHCGIEYFNGECDQTPRNSVYAAPVCLPCGDKICGQFENKCNCPEDCK